MKLRLPKALMTAMAAAVVAAAPLATTVATGVLVMAAASSAWAASTELTLADGQSQESRPSLESGTDSFNVTISGGNAENPNVWKSEAALSTFDGSNFNYYGITGQNVFTVADGAYWKVEQCQASEASALGKKFTINVGDGATLETVGSVTGWKEDSTAIRTLKLNEGSTWKVTADNNGNHSWVANMNVNMKGSTIEIGEGATFRLERGSISITTDANATKASVIRATTSSATMSYGGYISPTFAINSDLLIDSDFWRGTKESGGVTKNGSGTLTFNKTFDLSSNSGYGNAIASYTNSAGTTVFNGLVNVQDVIITAGQVVFNGTARVHGNFTPGAGTLYIGENGSLTIDGNLVAPTSGGAVKIAVHGVGVEGVANRATSTRTALTVTGSGLSNASWFSFVDARTGAAVSNGGTVSGHSVTISDYTQETLVWDGGSDGTWSNGASGWHKQSDTAETPADTGFINGDHVIFHAGATVTVSGDVDFDTMAVDGDTSISIGTSQTLSGNKVLVTNGTLTYGGASKSINGVGTGYNTAVGRWETQGEGAISITGGFATGTDTVLDGNISVDGTMSVVSGKKLTIAGGNISAERFIVHDSNVALDTADICGGVLNITSTNTGENTTSAGVLVGHWPTPKDGRARLNIKGGVLNAQNTTMSVGWDSRADLYVTNGEVNLYKLMVDAKTNNLDSVAYLQGGRLNIGGGGITTAQSTVRDHLNISGGTLGTLTAAQWNITNNLNIATSNSFQIDTEVRETSETGASSATGTAGDIRIQSAIKGSGDMTKVGVGKLTLSGALANYTGSITMTAGEMVINNAALSGYAGSISVTGGVVNLSGDNSGYTGTISVAGASLAAQSDNALIDATVSLGQDGNLVIANGVASTVASLALTGTGTTVSMGLGASLDGCSRLTVTSLTTNGNSLAFDFSTPDALFENDVDGWTLASGLGSNDIQVKLNGLTVDRTDSDGTYTWSVDMGRSKTYSWALTDGVLTFGLDVREAANTHLYWTDASTTEWNQRDHAWSESDTGTASTIFQNGDDITFAADATLDFRGNLIIGSLEVADSKTVALTSATTDTCLVINDGLTVGESASFTITADGEALRTNTIAVAAGGAATINGAVTGSSLAITAGAGSSVNVTGNVSGLSSVAAGEGGSVSLTGGSITTSGNSLTLNGDITVGNAAGSTTFSAATALTIKEGSYVTWNAQRLTTNGNATITIERGATLDASNGILWTGGTHIGTGASTVITLDGTLVVADLTWGSSTLGKLNHNAPAKSLGDGARIEVTRGSGSDGHGVTLNGTAASNTYTFGFHSGADSTLTLGGGLRVANNNKEHNLAFEVADGATLNLSYTLGESMSSNWDRVNSIAKTGNGDMTISNGLDTFTGGLSVEGGKLTLNAALAVSSINVSNAAEVAALDTANKVTKVADAELVVNADTTVAAAGSVTIGAENTVTVNAGKKISFGTGNSTTKFAGTGAEGTMKGVTLSSSSITGATSGTAGAADFKSLGEMTKLDITAVAAMEVKHVTMTDVHIDATNNGNGSGVAVTYGENGGRDVTAIASTATLKGAQARMFSLPAPGIAGDLEGENSRTLTTTAVQTGGSASGKLTVDVDYSLLSANRGNTLELLIFDGVTIADGFELQLGDVLSTLVNNGLPVVQISEDAGANYRTITAADIKTADYNLLAAPQVGATVILQVVNVPEPATGALSVLALAALAARRRRKKKN